MTLINCIGQDGVEGTFDYTYWKDQFDEKWHFHVQTVPPQPNGEAYDQSLMAVDHDTVRQITMDRHNHAAYRATGITETMIAVAAHVLGKKVVSSPTTAADTSVYRTPEATKVWKRLQNKGLATYDEATDVYTYTGASGGASATSAPASC
jgi:hypothetical protein